MHWFLRLPARAAQKHALMLGLILIGTLAVVAGVAYATIPGSDNLINGCYDSNNGQLRVLDPTSSKKALQGCKHDETPISWNAKGQDGAPGVNGQNGKDGTDAPKHIA